jgi:uncharacterized NAD-dependent epimerase/dehydratase family protein
LLIPAPYLIFLGGVTSALDAKTGYGLRDWRGDDCLGQYRLAGCSVDLGLPDMTPAQARAAGAATMVIGVAPTGGQIEPGWIDAIAATLDAGLNVASGMHTRLASVAAIAAAAQRSGAALYDVRHGEQAYPVASGRKRRGLRLLTVGTDCAVGKKYTALCVARELKRRQVRATFRATGQTGILITGRGVAIDAVVADFVAGAAEWLSPDNDYDHWDVIEGQGSLFHPAYAAVSTGLLHGSQPDALVLCHDPRRTHIDEYPDFPIPDLDFCAEANLAVARLTNRHVTWSGISVNTAHLDARARAAYLDDLQARFDVPCFDPVATGAQSLLPALARIMART